MSTLWMHFHDNLIYVECFFFHAIHFVDRVSGVIWKELGALESGSLPGEFQLFAI